MKIKTLDLPPNGKNNLLLNSSKQNIHEIFNDSWSKISLHGLHFLGDRTLGKYEKILWSIILIMALTSTTYVCTLNSSRFNSSPLSTVFEDTNLGVSNINFPAVTICNNNRINVLKMDDAVKRFIPDHPKEREKFEDMVLNLQNFDFDTYHEIKRDEIPNSEIINRLNLTEVALFMAVDCQQFFLECRWANSLVNCCDFFSIQFSPYGVCFSFNSFSNQEINYGLHPNKSKTFPRRIGGSNSGLRIILNTLPEIGVRRNYGIPGIYVMIHDPFDWPRKGKFIPANNMISFVVEPTLFSTSPEVRSIPYMDRLCIFTDEADHLNISKLKDFPYTETNCRVKCEKEYSDESCGCVIGWMFPLILTNMKDCNVSGLECVMGSDMKSKFYQQAFEIKNTTGRNELSCFCLPECHRVDYLNYMEPLYDDAQFPLHLLPIKEKLVQISVHYKSHTMVKYRTDVVFGILDLISAFGGIAGLFMGCSLLTFVEILYIAFSVIVFKLKMIFVK